jgi:hypothetical protein
VLLCPIDSKEFVVLPMPNHDSVVTRKVIRSHSNAFRQNKLWTSQTIDHLSPQHYKDLTATDTALVIVLSDQIRLSKEKVVFCVISSHTYKAKATHQHHEHDLPSPPYLSQYPNPPQKPCLFILYPSLFDRTCTPYHLRLVC